MCQSPAGCTEWLRRAAQQQPGASALVLEGDQFDYARLHSITAQVCQVLAAHGAKTGVTIVAESRSVELLVFLLHAALFADFTLFPLDPRLPRRLRERLVAAADADLIISEDEIGHANSPVKVIPVVKLLAQARQAKPLCTPATPVGPDRPRLLLTTSGSSGEPRLVRLSDDNLQASVRAANQILRLSGTSVWLGCLPLVHVGSLSILLRCVCATASVVLHQGFEAAAVARDLSQYRITHISLVPTMLAQLLESAQRPPPDLQGVLVGGAPLEPALAGRAVAAGWPVWVTYGMTETASMLTARRLGAAGDNPQQLGVPLPGFELRTVDEGGRPIIGPGVVQVRGRAVSHDGHPHSEAWFTSGDRGQLDSAGRLTLLGRADSMLVSGGEKVHPELVEQLLAAFPGIDDVAVTGQADPLWGERIVAVYRGAIDVAALTRLCRDGIHGPLRPREFVRVDHLPRTANGKLDRAALRRLVTERH